MRCIVFHLGEGRYALPLRNLVEVLPLLEVSEVPHAPDYIDGLINYRGHAVPVLDVCQLLLHAPCRDRISTRLVVVRLQRGLLALKVEKAVSEVYIDPKSISASPLQLDATPYLDELAMSPGGPIQLVDVMQLLPEEVLSLLYPEEMHAS